MTFRAILALIAAITLLTACGGGGGGGSSSDTRPDAINLGEETDAALSTQFTDTVTITGIDASTTISITGGEYSLDSGTTFTSENGRVTNNQEVIVRGTSAATVSTDVDVVLTVGGVTGTFTITTFDDTTAPTVAIAFPPPASMTQDTEVLVRGTATDDYSGIATLQVNGVDVTDTSDNGSYSTWQIRAALTAGENTLTVTASDSAVIANEIAVGDQPSVAVRSDAAMGDFPDSDNPLSYPEGIAVDYERNRIILGDRDLATFITVNMDTGARTTFSDNSTPSSIFFPNNRPDGLLVDAENDRMFVTNYVDDVIYEIDLVTGVRTEISSNVISSDAPVINNPTALIFHPENENELVVFDSSALVRVNLLDGVRTTLSSAGQGDHDPVPDNTTRLGSVLGGVYDSSRSGFFVMNNNSTGEVVFVSLSDGARTIFSDNTTPNSNAPLFDQPQTIAFDEENERLLANEIDLAALISVDTSTANPGVRSIFSDATTPNAINVALTPEEIYYDGNLGYAYWVDSVLDALLAVDIETGERVFVTRGDSDE
ncbi:MAG: hypothetical protein K6L76_01510 [Agarilytica sp.]